MPDTEYTIHRTRDHLDSTAFVEIGPGRYSGKHWQPGFLFLSEDAFGMAEGIVARHLPTYDHFGMNDVPRAVGDRVIADWRAAATALGDASAAEGAVLLNLQAAYRFGLEADLAVHAGEVASLLRDLADECERFYVTSEWICILGL